MHKHLLNTLIGCAGVLALGIASASAQDAERGHELFLTVGCYQCHGTVGQGSGAGARLAPNPLPVEALRDYIRAPAQVMPPYEENVLSDEDVADIHAYLATVPEPPALEDTILGQ
jgi:ubiquinol-cytochrome c reductase cytochrome c subunit